MRIWGEMDAYEENDYWNYINEAYDNDMESYFGSSYYAKENNKLNEFKQKCFVIGETQQ